MHLCVCVCVCVCLSLADAASRVINATFARFVLLLLLLSSFHFTMHRYAFSYGLPALDADSQITDGNVQQDGDFMEVSFTLPCQSTDSTRDISIEGSHYFLFAMGRLGGTSPIYHGQTRYFTSMPQVIDCSMPQGIIGLWSPLLWK